MKSNFLSCRCLAVMAGLFVAPLPGCSSGHNSGGSSNAGGEAATNSESTAGAPTTGLDDNLCGLPGASAVFASGKVDGAVALTTLRADDETLFLGAYHALYAIPINGGEPEPVYEPTYPIPAFYDFWIRGDSLVVWGFKKLDIVPKNGGAIKTLDLGSQYTDGQLDPGGNAFYAVKDMPDAQDEFDTHVGTRTWWRFDMKSGETLQLAPEKSLGYEADYQILGDYVYSVEAGGKDQPEDETPDRLFRIPIDGGAAQEVPVEGAFHMELAGARGDNLYFIGSTKPAANAIDNLGVYRISTAGGKPVLVVDHAGLAPSKPQFGRSFTTLADHDVLCFAGDCFELPVRGTARHLTGSRCITGATLATEDAVFLTVDDVNDAVFVIRVPQR